MLKQGTPLGSGPLRLVTLAAALGLFAVACSRKPDTEMCGQYYGRLVQLGASAHPALVAAARTGEGKQAIVDYCLQLARSQVKCSLSAGTLQEAADCEQPDRRTFLEKYF